MGRTRVNWGLGLLCAAVSLTACPNGSGPAATAGDGAATATYWEELYRARVPADLFELSSDVKDGPDQFSQQNVLSVLRERTEVERSRCEHIAGLSVNGVDPELTEYAARVLKARAEWASVAEAGLQTADRARSTFEPGPLAFAFLLSAAAHANEGDAALGSAFVEQLSAKAADVQNLQRRGEDFAERMRGVRELADQLRADAVALRGRLTQRYGREFPAGSSFPQHLPPPAGAADAAAVTRDVLARELIGHTVASGGSSWTFDSVKELTRFDVESSAVRNGVARFGIKTHVRGLWSGAEHDLSIRMTYRYVDASWRLFSVESAAL
jgi:hypothetical protein